MNVGSIFRPLTRHLQFTWQWFGFPHGAAKGFIFRFEEHGVHKQRIPDGAAMSTKPVRPLAQLDASSSGQGSEQIQMPECVPPSGISSHPRARTTCPAREAVPGAPCPGAYSFGIRHASEPPCDEPASLRDIGPEAADRPLRFGRETACTSLCAGHNPWCGKSRYPRRSPCMPPR